MAFFHGHDLMDRFVRRVGVARTTSFLCVVGLATAALTGARPVAAALGLTMALCGGLAALGLTAAKRGSSRPARPLMVASILLVGLFASYLGGSVRVMALADGELGGHVGERIRAELVITGQVRSNSGWQSAVAEIRAGTIVWSADGASAVGEHHLARESVLFEVAAPSATVSAASAEGRPLDGTPVGDLPILTEGAIVVCEGTVREPEGPTASGFDQRSYLRRQGIEVVLRSSAHDVVIEGSRGGFWGLFDRIRARARTDLSRGPEARLDEVLQGVVMGDTAGLDESWLDAFRRSGTAHMLSVSGLHVGCLAAIMLGLARLAGLSRGIGFLLAALAALSMIPFAGPSPPVIRAAIMILVVLAGRWVGRGRDQWQVLALAACAVLALNPLALFDVGFQLSFGAFAGMLALAAPLQRRLRRLPTGVSSNLAVSIAASLGTAPISLLVFGQTSLVGAIANLLVIPVLPYVTGLGMASVLLGYVWAGFSTVIDWLAAPANAWTVEVSRMFAAAPVLREDDLGRALTAAGAALVLLPVALALAGRVVHPPLGVALPYFQRTQRWIRARRPRSHALGAVLALVVVSCALLVGAGAYTPLAQAFRATTASLTGRGWPDRVEIRVLDVGQGNAVLVRTPGRHALLFDGGPAGCGLEKQLTMLGVRKLDVVVISHPHADHFTGLLECAEDIEVGTLIDPTQVVPAAEGVSAKGDATAQEAGPSEAQDYLALRRRLSEQGAEYLAARTGSSVDVDGVRVTFFAPSRPLSMAVGPDPWGPRGSPPGGEELNGSSLVAVLDYGEAEVLLPGDAESEVLERYDLPQVDVVVVPHHGSRGACSAELLSGLGVKAAAVSVGEDNSFGHPDPDTVTLLEQHLSSVARTDRAGWVCYTTDGTDLVLTTERNTER